MSAPGAASSFVIDTSKLLSLRHRANRFALSLGPIPEPDRRAAIC
jgi:hypothetical protein